MTYTNSTLDGLGMITISTGTGIIGASIANPAQWVQYCAVGGLLVLIGLVCVVVKYKIRK